MSYKTFPSRKQPRHLSTSVRLGVAAVAACFLSAPVLSNPLNPTVVNGAATFNQVGKVLTVTNSPGAIINWQKFSIQAGETTHFAQTAASSSVLNRVLSDPTAIYGTLSSNGRVWLVNPAGIMVGPGGKVDVAGFVASTLNISNADFLAGRNVFINDGGAGNVINQGEIRTPAGGSVYLIGSNVSNEGIITTPKGETILAAGATVSLIDSATPGVKVDITGAEGNATNLGSLTAEAGRIGIAGVIVRNSGTANASSVVAEGGRIFLKASQDAYVDGNGRIVTTGTRGGSVEVLGNRVAVMDNAGIDASGTTNGGGRIMVGGDYQGKNPEIQNANATYFGPNASLKADAGKVGDGGTVIVWADDTTRAYGNISARGGATGGDGGFVEVSGHRYLDFRANVDTRAPMGKTGSLLLDPMDVQIVAYGGPPSGDPYLDNNGGSSSYGGTAGVFGSTGSSNSSTLYWETIDSQLISNNVVVTTIGGGPTAYGDIALIDSHFYSSSNSLSLLAHRNIEAANKTLENYDNGGITLVAGWNGSTSSTPAVGAGPGSINASGASFSTVGGAFNAQASDSITLGTINTDASWSSGLKAGNVYIKAFNGTLAVASISAIGSSGGGGVGGYGGKVTLWASGPLTVAGGINATGGDGYSGYGGGRGGDVTLESLGNNVTVTGFINVDGGEGGWGNATVDGGKGGTGGDVMITASNGMISVGEINAKGGGNWYDTNSEGGYGGSITLYGGGLSFGNLYARGGDGGEGRAEYGLKGGDGGKGGSISLTATNGHINFSGRWLDARGGEGGWGDSNYYDETKAATDGGHGGDGGKMVLLASNGNIIAGDGGAGGWIDASGGRGGNGGYDYHGVGGGGNGGNGGDAGGISLTGKAIVLESSYYDILVRASGGDGGEGGDGFNTEYGGTGVYTVKNAGGLTLCTGIAELQCNGGSVYGGGPASTTTTMIYLPTNGTNIDTTAGGAGGAGGHAGNLVDESSDSVPNIVLVATYGGVPGIKLGAGSNVDSMGGNSGQGGYGRTLPGNLPDKNYSTWPVWDYYQETINKGLTTEHTEWRPATYEGTGVDGNKRADWGGWGSSGWTHMESQAGVSQPVTDGWGGLRTGRLTFLDLVGGGIVGNVSLLGQSNSIDAVSGHVTGNFTFDGRNPNNYKHSQLYNIGEEDRPLTVGGNLLVHNPWWVNINNATVTGSATVLGDDSISTYGQLSAGSIVLMAKRDIWADGALTATAQYGGITLKAGWDFDGNEGSGAPSGYGGNVSLGSLRTTGTGTIEVTARGAIVDGNGTSLNLDASEIRLTSYGGAYGGIAISADVGYGGNLSYLASTVDGTATYGGISIFNHGLQPATIVLNDGAEFGGTGLNGGRMSIAYSNNYGGLVMNDGNATFSSSNSGDIAIVSAGNFDYYGGVVTSNGGGILLAAGAAGPGDLNIHNSLGTSGDLGLVASASLNVMEGATASGYDVALIAPTVNIYGAVSASHDAVVFGNAVGIYGGAVSAVNDALVFGKTIILDGGEGGGYYAVSSAGGSVKGTNVFFGGTSIGESYLGYSPPDGIQFGTGALSVINGGYAKTTSAVYDDGGQLEFNLASVTASNGGYLSADPLNPNSNITGTVSGNITLEYGAFFEAGNDIHLTFKGGNSVISASYGGYLLASAPTTIYLDFLTRESGGVFIDGQATTTSIPYEAGFFVGDWAIPATQGAGLVISNANPPPPPPPPPDTCATNPALCPPPPPDTCATNPALCPPPPPVSICDTDPEACKPPPVIVDPCASSPDLCKPPAPIEKPIVAVIKVDPCASNPDSAQCKATKPNDEVAVVKVDPCATNPDSAQCKATKSGDEKEKQENGNFGDKDGKPDEQSSQKRPAQCGV